MLTSDEIQRSLAGAWLLALGRDEGMRAFDVSLTGFWRSFRVIVLMLPLYLVMMAGQRAMIIDEPRIDAATFPDDAFFFFNLLVMVLDWIAYPLVVAAIARPIGIADRYVPFIVARNWTSLLALVPYAVPMLLYWLGIAGPAMTSLLLLVALGLVLRYRFVMTRAALATPTSLTIGLVVLDFSLSLALSLSVNRMIGL